MFDRYLSKTVRENMDYEIVIEELWEFLQSRYGCDYAILRAYNKAQFSYFTEVEARLKWVPIFFVRSDLALKGFYKEEDFEMGYVQIRKKMGFT